jgi:GNAT acetyltransferase-like protein
MDILFTKDEKYLKQWDAFISENEHANHLQLSDWLKSYQSYGFDFELCLMFIDNKIVGGYGAVIARVLFFKFYIIPNGPLLGNSNSNLFPEILEAIQKRAKIIKCCYCQFNLPVSVATKKILSIDMPVLSKPFIKGSKFSYVYNSNGINWLDFGSYNDIESLINDFKSSVRRDVRSSERKNQVVEVLTEENNIKEAYELCLENARRAGYGLRSWNSFKNTILNLVKNNQAKFIAAYKDNQLKGAIFLVKSGGYYTYIFGGVKRENPDLLTGHFLQWEAIKMSFDEGCSGYNISLGGSEGVKSFKAGFNVQQITDENSKYYFVLNRKVFNLFLFFEKRIKPQKNNIAKLLSLFKKNK